MTRPDLSFAVHNLAKFCEDLGPVHWKAPMKALRCFWRTNDLVSATAELRPGQPTSCLRLEVVMLGGGVTSWSSHAQRVTASASSESEYVVPCGNHELIQAPLSGASVHHVHFEELHDFNHEEQSRCNQDNEQQTQQQQNAPHRRQAPHCSRRRRVGIGPHCLY